MAQYNMTAQIRKIAEIKGTDLKDTARELGISFKEESIKKVDGEWITVQIADSDLEFTATSRREEGAVIAMLREAEAEEAKKEAKQEAKENFHWIKETSGWFVKGDFTGYEIGDEITVYRVSGSTAQKYITGFTTKGYAAVSDQKPAEKTTTSKHTVTGPVYDDDSNPTYFVDGRAFTAREFAKLNLS